MAVVAAFAGISGTTVYFVGHPQISTVTSSTTGTVSQTQTETSFSTETKTVVSTSVSTQNLYPNYNFGNPNYQCQYPNQYQCYGQGQTQQIYGYLAPSQVAGGCIYLTNTNTGFTYALYDQYGNMVTNYPTGYVSVQGTIPYNQNYYACSGIPLLLTHF